MPPTTEQILAAMESFPLHAQFGLTLGEHGDGVCAASCQVGAAHLNYGGVVHGGVMYLLLDVVAYCAAMTRVRDGYSATTHDIHVSVLRPTPAGVQLDFRAEVRKAGRSLYFIDVEAHVDDKLMASARVTKSLVPLHG